MSAEPRPPAPRRPPTEPSPAPSPRRVFLHEPGWSVALKLGSDRVFCYMMAPGQDYYHRLLDGELYVYHGDERLCLACAQRRGLLSFESRGLGGVLAFDDLPTGPAEPPSPVTPPLHRGGFDLAPPRDAGEGAPGR